MIPSLYANPYASSAPAPPARCEVCGRTLPTSTPSPADAYAALIAQLLQPYAPAPMPMPAAPMHRHDCGCGCGCHERKDPCGHDDCHCRCCVGDADLVVYSRVGERRIVPIVVENRWRRERDVTLTLGEFRTRGGKTASVGVTGGLVGETAFTLKGCEERSVILAVNSNGFEQDPNGQGRELGDVEECTVLYADLTVTGCDLRPVRIAVALLPRDCGAFHVDCRCGCC